MLIDLFLVGLVVIGIADLVKLFIDQVAPHYTPKHGRRRSA